MINETYIEVMVKRKTSAVLRIAGLVAALFTGIFALLAIMGFAAALVIALVCGAAAYFLGMYTSVEYEYTYVDRELQIDRILGKARRKRMETLDLLQMEIMAPIGSHQLDGYRNRNQNQKPADYSSGEVKRPESRYMLCMNDRQLILEPGEELVKIIQGVAPRKVFTY